MAFPENFVQQVSKTLVKPSPLPQFSGVKRCNLTPWDLSMLSVNYIECGLLYSNLHVSLPIDQLTDNLKESLSAALFHFYPLAGRLVTEEQDDSLVVSVECSNGGGAEFVRASAEQLKIEDVIAANADVPSFIQSFFPCNGAVNYDGHFLPLLAVQVTELADGVFLGCSMNHAVADGAAFWNFFQSWAEICRKNFAKECDCLEITVSRQPIHDRWFVDGVHPPVKLPFSKPDQFIDRYTPPANIRVRIFHFTSESIARLKSIANDECNSKGEISSFQALCSLVWRSLTRARRLQPDQKTTCRLASNDRSKLKPPLSPDYFGNFVTVIGAAAASGDLLANGLGWASRLLQQRVAAHTDSEIRSAMRAWAEAPVILSPCKINPVNVSVLSSPHFGVYNCDFGWGRPAAVRTGCTFKADGVVAAYPGREVEGSVDLEVYLMPEAMEALESDEEFMSFASH